MRLRLCIGFVLLVPILLSCQETVQENGNDLNLCKKTVRDYALFRDDPAQADAYGALFTEDGTFTLAGNTAAGRAALIGRHKAANEAAQWRHNMIDIDIRETDTGPEGRTRFVVYTGPRADTPGSVSREIIGYYEDKFVMRDGTCLIQDRRVVVEFDSQR